MRAKNVQLSEVCEIIAGQSPPSSTYNTEGIGLPFFQGKADFGEIYPTVRYWCSSPNKIAKPDDILLSVRAPVGDTNICNQESCIGRGLAAIRTGNDIDNKFLLHYLRQNAPKLVEKSNGSTFQAITMKDVREIVIPLPPLSEQKRIAAILDKAEEIKRKREESFKLADEFLKSVFVDMFGDPVTNPKGWEMKHLKEYITFLTSGSRGWAKYYSTSGEKFLRIQNVGRNRLLQNDMALVDPPDTQEAIRTKVRPNDLLISITADLGRTAVIPENFGIGYINQHLALVRLNGIVPLFISEFLKSEGGRLQFNSMNRSGVKSGLNFDNIKSLIIPVPPLEMQEEFAFLYKRYETNSERLIKASTIAEDLCSSLSQRAFSSRL